MRQPRPSSWFTNGAALAGATALIALCGVVHGQWTGRWSDLAEASEDAARRLSRLPSNLGDWEGRDGEMDAKAMKKTAVSGHLFRRYVHGATGEEVSVFLVCGRSGPISVHTPDVCYRGAGYELIGATSRCRMDGAEFWMGEFAKARSPLASRLRILWSWSAGAGWQAPDQPRVYFARAACLHKLYVVHAVTADKPLAEDSILQEFVGLLIPQLESTLFGTEP